MLLGLVLLAVSATLVQAENEGPKAIREECRKKYGIESEQLEEYKEQQKLPETENGKCFIECTLEKYKIMDNGKINFEQAKTANAYKLRNKPDLKAKADQVVDACKGVEATGKCELAIAFVKCMVAETEKMGLKTSDFH